MNSLLLTILLLSHQTIVCQCNSKWRHFYIAPDDGASQKSCPVDYCYSLQDVIRNQSHFFDSNTTLELLPGRYDITERVGQLTVANVSHFVLRGSKIKQKPATTITCHQTATFGLTFVNTVDIAVSDIEIAHCCAELTENITIDATRVDDYIPSDLDPFVKQWFRGYQGYCDEHSRLFPCCTTVASINSVKTEISRITVLHSKGVGILILRYATLHISDSLLAHCRINCLLYVSNNLVNTTTILSRNQIQFGNEGRFKLASGLNIIVASVSLVNDRFDNINASNNTFTSNVASMGNFYLLVYRGVECRQLPSVQMTIANTTVNSTSTGFTMAYIILERIPLRLRYNGRVYEYWPQCLQQGVPLDPRRNMDVTCNMQNFHFKGSCMIIKNLLKNANRHLSITMTEIKIDKSSCPVALQLEQIYIVKNLRGISPVFNKNSITLAPRVEHRQLHIQNIAITSSRHNIIVITGIQDHTYIPVHFLGNITFTENQGSVVVENAGIIFEGNVQISNNQADDQESVFLIRNRSKVSLQGDITFTSNRGRQGGAISAYGSALKFQGKVRFLNNTAYTTGGGISLREGSTIDLRASTHLTFTTNTAREYGGGIFVEETLLWDNKMTLKCFVTTSSNNSAMVFSGNRAGLSGMALFGGWIDACTLEYYTMRSIRPPQFMHFRKYRGEKYMHTYSGISSNPSRVCICRNGKPIVNITRVNIETIPGKTFEIEVVAVGQRFGVVSAIVEAKVQNHDGNNNIIPQVQRSQNVGTRCTRLSYVIHSRNDNETMQLVIDRQRVPRPGPYSAVDPLQFEQLEINIHLNNCPVGFIFDSNTNTCACHHSLIEQGTECNVTSQTVTRKAHTWISAVHEDKIAINHHCPYDYCKDYVLSLNLSTPNTQCAFNRSGILCGACQPGRSQVLGTSNCKTCSDTWLFLILLFGVVGVALVLGLMVLNITVSAGTINGLIFYANIVRANNAIFFPGQSAKSFLSWFVAWLNLDLGIETCFYDGLGATSKTWLQFAFPVYIWVLVTAMIISSHYSTRAAKICGNNAVQVLATLFFLSYAKLLRVTITVFRPTKLLILDDDFHRVKVVWSYDGNLDYLSKQHTLLFAVTLLFVSTLFIPYTLALFGIQWLQPLSHHKPLFWVHKLKPLFDAYTGPYKDKHRYWTGLLLLLRVALFCAFSANTSGDPATNLLVITIATVCLIVYLGLVGGVYKSRPLNILEYVFLVNVVILSAGTLFTIAVERSVLPVSQLSVGVTLGITVMTIMYQSIHTFVERYHVKEKMCTLKRVINKKLSIKSVGLQKKDFKDHASVTYSVVEMEEKLLQN